MPSRSHHFAKYNHLGRGSTCHRCEQADKLEAKVQANPKNRDAQIWANEAARLRGPAGKKPPIESPDTKRSVVHVPYEDDGYRLMARAQILLPESYRALTPRQKDTLDYICRYFEQWGGTPTQEEIRAHMGLLGTRGTRFRIARLLQLGYLERLPGRSGYRIIRTADGTAVRAVLVRTTDVVAAKRRP